MCVAASCWREVSARLSWSPAFSPSPPDTPTLAEQGIKSYLTYSWWGICAPAGMPAPVLERMNGDLGKAVRSADVAQKLAEQPYLEALASTPEEFAAFQKAEQERWFRIIRENNIKTD